MRTDKLEAGILFLDDDIEILDKYKELFSLEFNVYKTNSPENALNIIANYDIGVVICDYFMPKMSGIEFLNILLKKNPLIRRILISGQMNVNIAMESIDISKVHKILIKPFVVNELKEEINSQLRIYKSQLKDIQKSITPDKEIRSPFDLFELQTHKIISCIQSHSKNDNTADYPNGLNEIVNLTLYYSKRFMELYQKDSMENTTSLEYVKQNLDDLEVISNIYSQCYLFAYTLVGRIYLGLVEEEIDQVTALYTQFTNYIQIHHLDVKPKLKTKTDLVSTILQGKLNQDSKLNEETNHEIINGLINLFEFNIRENLNLNISFHEGFVDQTKYFTILILKNNSAVFFKNKLPNIDLEQLSNSIDFFETLASDIHKKNEMFHIMHFNAGIFQTSIFGSFKYILVSSDNTIQSRLKLRKFIVETLDLVKTIPILTIPNKDDVKLVNKIAKDLFGI